MTDIKDAIARLREDAATRPAAFGIVGVSASDLTALLDGYERLAGAIIEATPHIGKVARCASTNDEMGRVVVGQTEAARELARIFAALSIGDQ